MLSIARTIFGRLYEFDPTEEEAKLRVHEDEPQHGDLSLSVSTTVTSQGVDNEISPDACEEGTEHTDAVTQGPAKDATNISDRTAEGSVPSIVVPRSCRFEYTCLESFAYLIHYRRASCSFGTPSGACQYS